MKYLFLVFLLLGACAHEETQEPVVAGGPVISDEKYNEILTSHTATIRKYVGFYNTIEMQGVLLTPDMVDAQIKQNTRLYQWDADKVRVEREKMNSRLNSDTEIFLAFYTPERKNDNLDKVQTLWKVFIDANGHRYEGKITKIKLLPGEIMGMYPFYSRFCTPYNVTIPVPAAQLSGPVRLTVTGSLSSASIDLK